MGQRNMVCTSQMLDLEMDEVQGQVSSDPCLVPGNMARYPHPDIYPILLTPGSTSHNDLCHLPDHHASTSSLFYGMQSNGLQHHHPFTNSELGASSSYLNTYLIPSSDNRIYALPQSHCSSDRLSASTTHGIVGLGTIDYEGNTHFTNGVRSSCKRKNTEIPMNHHYFNGSASSSTSALGMPPNIGPLQSDGHLEPVGAMLDTAAFRAPDYRSNAAFSITDGGSGSRSSTLNFGLGRTMHNHNNLFQGNYMGQSFQPTNSAWVEQRFGSSGMPWNGDPLIPYLHGGVVNESSLEMMNMGGQGYSLAMNSRSSTILSHPNVHHHFHHPAPPPMQAMHAHNYNYHPQAAMPSYRHTTNTALHHGTLNSSVDSSEMGSRYPRPIPSNGLRTFRPHQSEARHSERSHLRMLSVDEVAILELPGYYEAGNINDPHEDMRLDIDDMSYEELLALGGRIGNVKAGLSEESILSRLKTRVHCSSITVDTNQGTCIVCQDEYENQEKIGTLDCGHEYHAGCIKQWLQVKNMCPICKTPAFAVENING